MTRHIESHLQRMCVSWFRLQYPDIGKLLFAVPNGGARSRTEAAIMKAEGVTAGVADVILLVSRGGYNSLCIEFKTEKGRQTELQKQWQLEAENNGNKYVVCRSFSDFNSVIKEYLNYE